MQKLIIITEESKDLILLFKIPMGTRKGLFEIYRKFGHAPSKSFASPWLGAGTLLTGKRTLYQGSRLPELQD